MDDKCVQKTGKTKQKTKQTVREKEKKRNY